MKLAITAALTYDFTQLAGVLLQLQAARDSEWGLVSESLDLKPSLHTKTHSDGAGHYVIFEAPAGRLAITYNATVEGEGSAADLAGQPAAPITGLPVEVLPYLRPSAYCPANRFEPFVKSRFGEHAGGDKVMAISEWIRTNIDYRAGVSDCNSTAMDTFTDRAGVCRDFAHLCIALCRAADIPARIVSAYALDLEPPDFHAVVEVYVGEAWRRIDPTGLAREDHLIPISHGRDAADVPFMTIFGAAELVEQTVEVRRV